LGVALPARDRIFQGRLLVELVDGANNPQELAQGVAEVMDLMDPITQARIVDVLDALAMAHDKDADTPALTYQIKLWAPLLDWVDRRQGPAGVQQTLKACLHRMVMTTVFNAPHEALLDEVLQTQRQVPAGDELRSSVLFMVRSLVGQFRTQEDADRFSRVLGKLIAHGAQIGHQDALGCALTKALSTQHHRNDTDSVPTRMQCAWILMEHGAPWRHLQGEAGSRWPDAWEMLSSHPRVRRRRLGVIAAEEQAKTSKPGPGHKL
jgi:hypothetical protein